MHEQYARGRRDPRIVAALVRGPTAYGTALVLPSAHRPPTLAQSRRDAAVARTPGDAVQRVLDNLTCEEEAEVRHAIEAVLGEARAEGRLGPAARTP